MKHLENVKTRYVANRQADSCETDIKSIIEKGHYACHTDLCLHFECCLGFIVAGPETHGCAHLNKYGKNGTESQKHIFSLSLHWCN